MDKKKTNTGNNSEEILLIKSQLNELHRELEILNIEYIENYTPDLLKRINKLQKEIKPKLLQLEVLNDTYDPPFKTMWL